MCGSEAPAACPRSRSRARRRRRRGRASARARRPSPSPARSAPRSSSETTGSRAVRSRPRARRRRARAANRSGSPRPTASGSGRPVASPVGRERRVEVGHHPHAPAGRVGRAAVRRAARRPRAASGPRGPRGTGRLGVDRRRSPPAEPGAGPVAALAGDDHAQPGQRVDPQLRQGASPWSRARCPPRRRRSPARLVAGAVVQRRALQPARAGGSGWRRASRATSARPRPAAPRRFRGRAARGSTAIRPSRATPPSTSRRHVPTSLPVLDGHQVERLGVAAVAVGRRVHALLVAEHAVAQVQRGARPRPGSRASRTSIGGQRA